MTEQRRPLPLSGFVVGLVTGLGVAAIAAVYMTSAPLPFVNKVQRSTENVTPDAGDPNRSLFSAHIPMAQTLPGADTAAPAEAPRNAETPPATPPTPAPAATAAAPPASVAAPSPTAPEGANEGGSRLMLQVGAYKSAEDADITRARLALLGLDAKVTEVQVDGKSLYRVRLGPYGQLDDLNGIRRTLSENGMEPQLVHVR